MLLILIFPGLPIGQNKVDELSKMCPITGLAVNQLLQVKVTQAHSRKGT